MNAPLQLKKYYFTKILVEANPPPEGDKSKKPGCTCDVNLQTGKDGDNKYVVILSISIKPDKNGGFPYTVEFTIVGHFEIHPDWPEGEKEKMARINGASMLLGAAREQVAVLTGRGPNAAFILPAIAFNSFTEHDKVNPEEEKIEGEGEKPQP